VRRQILGDIGCGDGTKQCALGRGEEQRAGRYRPWCDGAGRGMLMLPGHERIVQIARTGT